MVCEDGHGGCGMVSTSSTAAKPSVNMRQVSIFLLRLALAFFDMIKNRALDSPRRNSTTLYDNDRQTH